MHLIGTTSSPFVRKVRIVLAEKRIDCVLEIDDVWSPGSRARLANPLGKVPCLVMDDGGAVFDSRVIVEHLDSLTPLHRMIPPSGRARTEVRTWEALSDGMLDAASLVRTELTRRAPDERNAAWLARQQDKVEAALQAMSTGLADKPWCVDARYSLADVALGCALGWLSFRFPQNGWRDAYPNLATHLAKLEARPAFATTAPR